MAEMAGILQKFLATKQAELKQKKLLRPSHEMEALAREYRGVGFASQLSRSGANIISEIKYRSPSEGSFEISLKPVDVASQYQRAGAAAISVLTDSEHFAGELTYLKDISRSDVTIPLLRKDFIVDRYQVLEASQAGAAAFLLIAACLEQKKLASLMALGESLGMDALVEVHNQKELDMVLDAGARIIGINNRNLDTLEVDIQTSFELARSLENEKDLILVSESGISTKEQINELNNAGFNAFLIGSSLMRSGEPGRKLSEFTGVNYAY